MLVIPGISDLSYGQGKIVGKVVDMESDSALAFASVTIQGRSMGTVTNEEGVFQLYTEAGSETDTVNISMMGYQSFRAPVSYLLDRNLVVKLQSEPVVLEEVVVKSNDSYPRSILLRALATKTNFPTAPYLYKGFIREMWLQSNKTVSLVEGVFSIYDDGYKPGRNNTVKIQERVDLKRVRASRNYMNEVFKGVAGRYNTLTSALRWNQVKYPNPSILGNLRNVECTLEEIRLSNGDSVAVIGFVTSSKSSENFERKDIFYVRLRNYEIMRSESREYARVGRYRNVPWTLPDSIYLYKAREVSTIYEFEEFNGKMYLKYFKEVGAADIFNTQSGSVEFEIESRVTMVITDIKASSLNSKMLNTINHHRSLTAQTTPYDSLFWANNTEVNLVPLTVQQLKDLEWEMPLDRQFPTQKNANEEL